MNRKRLGAGEGEIESAEEWRCPGWGTAYSHAPNIRAWLAEDGSHDRRCRTRPRDDRLGDLTGGMARNWGRCWKCNGSLGCAICTTPDALEILCRPCGAWNTREAFDHHGPIVANPKVTRPAAFADYPAEWRVGYEPPGRVSDNLAALAARFPELLDQFRGRG